MQVFEPIMNDSDMPLVSVLVYNYNYGRYLEECLQSIINQTYANVEIHFSDNASTDNSWEIASNFCKKYPGRISITRNARNLGSDANWRNCFLNARGKYCLTLSSDDVLLPNCIELCVHVFKKHQNLGFVMMHHAKIDAKSNRFDEPSFYNESCIIQGEDQAAVFMMASINPSISQVMYDKLKLEGVQIESGALSGAFMQRWYGARIWDFNLCKKYPMAYIKEAMVLYRVHGENACVSAEENLLEVIGPYMLIRQFYEDAKLLNLKKVIDRYPAAVKKLSSLALRYCIRYLLSKNDAVALRYFHLSVAVSSDIIDDDVFRKLQKYWQVGETEKSTILCDLTGTSNLVERKVSYDPPIGSVKIIL